MMRGNRYSDMLTALVCHETTVGMQKAQEIIRASAGHYDDDAVPAGPMSSLHPDLLDAAVEGVRRVRRIGGSLSPRDHHNEWVAFLTGRGWARGPKDPGAKTHPNLVDYAELDQLERDKDRVFIAVVTTLTLDH